MGKDVADNDGCSSRRKSKLLARRRGLVVTSFWFGLCRRPCAHLSQWNEMSDLVLVRISDNNADTGDCRQFLRCALRVASGYEDLGTRVFPMHTPDGGTRVLIGRSGHCTRVEHNYFGVIGRSGALHPAIE